ncbi:shikimate dehydrogenase [Tenacibaculum sp. UWU-22]|uniref:shikimate dehydrogenase family protein n=1 Tax=Tenacibaculum sp. UWU-22 TaxID=3234187 RepID=UPI0034DB234B
MEEKEKDKHLFALIGKNISYSFSREYFSKKFKNLSLHNYEYINFDIQEITELPEVIAAHKNQLKGMNVTIPYKLAIFKYLDKIDKKALKIGAVNTIKITKKGKLKGYNTDVYGFENSLKPLLEPQHTHALILGTGGASKAVAYALKKIGIKYKFVSRTPGKKHTISYNDLSQKTLIKYTLIINCTPLGTHPNTNQCPTIPYQFLTPQHFLYDLIYNPAETLFLKKGKLQGATIKNGLEMLELQAEKAWKIWNSVS